MDFFWTVSPFIVMFSLAMISYSKFKSNDEKKEDAGTLRRPSAFQYIKLVFYTRVFHRQSTILIYLFTIFSFLFLLAAINIYLGIPTVSIDKMKIKSGIVKEVLLIHKGLDELVLETKDGNFYRFVLSVDNTTKNKLLHKTIQIWYLPTWNLYHHEDKIYQIYMDNKPFHGGRFWTYDQGRQTEKKDSVLKFIKYDFLAMLVFITVLWLSNRKEPPADRLNRIKVNNKETE